MADTRLVTPDQIEDLAVHVLETRHAEHLAKFERIRGLRRETLLRLKSVTHWADDAAEKKPSNVTLPAVLLGVVDVPTWERDENDALNATVQLGVQVSVFGQNRRDTLRRRDWTTWTVIECLLQRLPRRDLIHSVSVVASEPIESGDFKNTLGDYRLVFDIEVVGMLAVVGGLPVDDTEWPAGGPNGPPARPYDPPAAAPVARRLTYSIDKEPLVS